MNLLFVIQIAAVLIFSIIESLFKLLCLNHHICILLFKRFYLSLKHLYLVSGPIIVLEDFLLLINRLDSIIYNSNRWIYRLLILVFPHIHLLLIVILIFGQFLLFDRLINQSFLHHFKYGMVVTPISNYYLLVFLLLRLVLELNLMIRRWVWDWIDHLLLRKLYFMQLQSCLREIEIKIIALRLSLLLLFVETWKEVILRRRRLRFLLLLQIVKCFCKRIIAWWFLILLRYWKQTGEKV